MKIKQPPAREIDKLIALFNGNKYAEGETLARQLTLRYPQNAFAWKSLGACLTVLGRKSNAVEAMKKSAKFNPHDAEAQFNLGTTLNDLERWSEAEGFLQRAVELNPAYIEAYNNLGDTLTNLGRAIEAEAVFRRAIERNPLGLEAHYNLANALRRQGRFAEAENSFRRALELQADNVEVRHNLGFLLLSLGRYAEGWPYYESRYHPKKIGRSVLPPELSFPQWQGESLAGKSLLIWPEQGFGDEIQFARYLPLLKASGVSRLTLVCKPPLKDLLQTLDGVDSIIVRGEAVPVHDYWAFPLSLPLLKHTTLETIPANLPYLSADPQRMALWKMRLPAQGFKVGLVWQGNAEHKNDSNRSLKGLRALAPLWSVPGVSFVSLQKGQGEDEAASPPDGQSLLALGSQIKDFADTAAIVAQLDLVICVDTSIAHLAGALGKPCWVLLPAVGTDWRWLHERTDSPWYPGVMRLFRQNRGNTWDETIESVALALEEQTKGTQEEPPHYSATKVPDKEINRLSALFKQNRFADGETLASQIVESHPESGFAWYLLGVCRMSMGKSSAAILPMQKAAELDASNAEVHCNLGIALKQQGQLQEAEQSYRRAIELKPAYVEAHYNLAITLSAQGRHADAESACRRVIQLNPKYAKAHINLGNAQKAQGKSAEAENSYRRAIKLQPGDATAHYNLGTILSDQGRLADAAASYQEAIRLDPAYAQAYGNLANTLKELGREEDAENQYRKALQLRPGYPQASNNYGILLLSLGRYAEGWPYYEARYDPAQNDSLVTRPRLPFPQWQGEALAGKSLVIWREQGFGDEIQFARYAPLLKTLGVFRLTLVCQPPLKALLQSLAGVDAVIAEGDPLPLHDYWAFPLSLPLRFGTTVQSIPASLPYLSADPKRIEKWRTGLPGDEIKVGLVWRGNAGHQNDAHRSLSGLAALAPLWSVPGLRFVSLQKGQGEDESASPPDGQPIVPLGSQIEDFADTAAIVAQLDLVICVDTSIAHLAGAMGKPCWVLLPARGTDWRWLQERNDSPWYPGVMRLFRQEKSGNWNETIEQVRQALSEWSNAHKLIPAELPTPDIETLAALFNNQRFEEALRLARALSLSHPDNADVWKTLGACLATLGRIPEALEPLQKATTLRPDDTEAQNNLAIAFKQLGRLPEAECCYRQLVTLQPDSADALVSLANTLRDMSQLREADESYRQALALNPNAAHAWFGLGTILSNQERLEDAEASYRRAIDISPNLAQAYSNLANNLKRQGRLPEAEALYREAIQRKPQYALAWFNLATTLSEQGRLAEAEALFQKTLDLQPNYIEACINLSNAQKEQGNWATAERNYRRAIEIRPDSREARYNLGVLLLTLGRYSEAWHYYEDRYHPEFKARSQEVPQLPFPQWRGEPLAGKSLMIWPEQGMGDEIQFARYAPLLKARGVSRLTLACQPELKTVMSSIKGVDAVATNGEPLPLHDYWVLPLSLPLHFGSTLDNLPSALPYLSASPDRLAQWQTRLPKKGFKVGLVWRGNTKHQNDANRSLTSLAVLAPLWSVPGVSFVSLQKGQGEDEANAPPNGQAIIALGKEFRDFADTAAVIAQLDLVICIDTSVAHLTGAIGKPCWVLLPAVSTDWRWLLERTDSPWYPQTMRLFRQEKAGDWDATLAEVTKQLRKEVDAKKDGRPVTPATAVKEPPIRELERLATLFNGKRFEEGLAVAAPLSKRYPQNAFIWKALGACLTSLGRQSEAIEAMQKAASLNPDDPEAQLNLAIAFKTLGRLAEAETCYRQLARLEPDNADRHASLGSVLSDQRKGEEAEASYRRSLELNPGNFRVHGNLANVLKALGRTSEAESAYRRAIELKPDYVNAHFNLAIALQDQGRLAEAESLYRKVLELKPDQVQAYINLGTLLTKLGRLVEAEQGCRRAIDIKPDYAEAHVNLANILRDQKRLAEAEASNRQAIALQPDFVPAHGNLGNVLLEQSRFSEAESSYKRAIELDPGYAQAYGNMGNALKEQRRFDEAESSYRRAMELDPNYAQARSNLGILLLYLSRFAEGWPYYEARYDPRQDEQWITLPDLPFPQWQGESLAGKSIALWPEQGFGDEIQFARYAPVLKAKGATSVTLVCKPALKALLDTVPDVDLTITQGEPVPPHDYWAFPLSLPLHLGTTLETIPASLPYLFADPERVALWRPQIPDAKLKVGLVWQGAGGHKNDANRSLTGLAALKPLWSIPGVSFVSLQKGRGEDEANSPPDGQPIVALGGKVRDFADTAAILEQLDLLICVDTSTAHLAGALGKPCWVLVPSVGTDWRWLHARRDSPWYPGVMRLFRQKSVGRWDDTVADLTLALQARVAEHDGQMPEDPHG